jgi:hypothetical protein
MKVPAFRLDDVDVQVRDIDVHAKTSGRVLARIGPAACVCHFVTASMG